MKGQWIGTYQGSVDGNIMVNIDELDNHYEGVAYTIPSEKNIPSSIAYLSTKNKNKSQKITAYIYPLDPRNAYQCEWEDIKNLYPADVTHSKEAEITLKIVKGELRINATTDIGTTLKSVLTKPSDDNKSKIIGEEMTWKQFKAHVSKISKSKYLFRGQRKPWRLRTSFHRRGRYRINKFTEIDVKQLHQRLSAITSH